MKASKSESLKARIGLSGPPLSRIPGPAPLIPDHGMVRCIGQGSYGEVWLARNAVGTWRAVKVVHRRNFKDPRPYEREFAGIQSYEPVSRTNEGLIDVLQIGRNDAEGYFYYVMELADPAAGSELPGAEPAQTAPNAAGTPDSAGFNPETYVPKTLSQVIQQRGRLRYEECLTLGLTLNLALGHLHRHGLIHRDVKPSNIVFVNGVPKLTDIGLVTDLAGAQSFVGTEGFIPPEGPNSPQGDLYALGKVLYEASMGKDRNEFPDPLTKLGLDADSRALMELNAVLIRACAPDPKARYKRAEEMNADLALLHNGESVRNKHALARRLRLMTRVGAGTIAVLVLAVIPYYLAIREMHRAKALARAETQQHKRADAVASFLEDTLKAAEPSVARGRDTRMLRELLDSTAEGLDTKFKEQPEVEAELRATLGQVYQELGDYINAEKMLHRALEIYLKLRGPGSRVVAQCLSDLSMAVSAQGKDDEAEQLQSKALAIRTRLPGQNDLLVAESFQCLGIILAGENNLSDAEKMFRRALEIRERELGRENVRVAESINGLATALSSQGQWSAAEAMFREGLDINRKLLGETHPSYLWMLNGLVQALLTQNKLREAETNAHRGLAIEMEVLPPNHPLIANSLTRLARVLEREGKTSEAKTNLYQALAIWGARLSNQDPSMGETINALFDILLSERNYPAAAQIFNQVSSSNLSSERPNKTLLFVCANYLARKGDWKGAQERFERVIRLDPGNHQAYQSLAAVYLQLDDENAYNELCTRILARFGSVTNDPRIADRMAKTCLMLPPKGQDLITAAKLANVAVTFDTKAAAHPWFHFCKGFAEYRQGKFESAKHWMEKVLEHEADGSTRDVEAYMILAMSEQMLHHDKAAQVAYAKGTKLARRRLRDENSGDIESGWTDWILAHRLMREAQAMTTDNSQEPAPPETLSAP